MKFDVTLAIVLVFLAPGMIVLSASPMHMTEPLDALRSLEKIPSASELLVLLSVAFLVGVALDSLRIVTIQPVIKAIAKRLDKAGLPQDYISHITAERLPVFEMLVQRSYEYYRLNCNIALGLLVVTVLHFTVCSYGSRFVIVLFADFLWLAISVRSKRDSDRAVRNFVQSCKR